MNAKREKRDLIQLQKVKAELGSLGAIDFLIDFELNRRGVSPVPKISYTPFRCKPANVPSDIEKYLRPPENFPKHLVLPPVHGCGNDYQHLLHRLDETSRPSISVIVLTYNRNAFLKRTLTGIVNQNYPLDRIEVVVTDDGGSDDSLEVVKSFAEDLDIKLCWHRDVGFTPAAARNNAIRMARYDFIVQLDVDMYPDPDLLKNYARFNTVIDKVALIGPRKYVDLNDCSEIELREDPFMIRRVPEIVTNNNVANATGEGRSIDWRLKTINKTNLLRKESVPFRMFAAGNVAFSKNRFNSVGGYEERFKTWGHEDGELGFRFYNSGMYFIPVMDAWAYHQEPVGGENETDRAEGKKVSVELYSQLCPYYRQFTQSKPPYEVPSVSIYIPAYNAEGTICDAVESALRQTFDDLEVVVCNDGSTDRTGEYLDYYYASHPRVTVIHRENSGIGAASNAALKYCKGIYIGQLDSDDYLAEDVVEKCVKEFRTSPEIGLVYTTYENEYTDGSIKPGYNYPVFLREKLLATMIVHHFRMFRRRDWARTSGFDENMINAVDYDMYLKLAEVTQAKHINVFGYRRRLHGENTSIKKNKEQNRNAARAVNRSLIRLGVPVRARLLSESESKLLFSPLK